MVLPIYVYGADVLRENAKEIDFASYEGLQELIANFEGRMTTGFVGTPHILHVLSENNLCKSVCPTG